MSLQVSTSDATTARCLAPPSEPAKSAFSRLSERTDRALDRVAVDLGATIVEETGEALPARERMADRLGELCLLADQPEFVAQPRLEMDDDRAAPFLADDTTPFRRSSTDVVFDSIQFGDPSQRLAGDRRGTGRREFVEAPVHVRPAEGEHDAARVGEHAIAAVAVDLRDSTGFVATMTLTAPVGPITKLPPARGSPPPPSWRRRHGRPARRRR